MIIKFKRYFAGCSHVCRQKLALIVLLLTAILIATAEGVEKRTLEVFVRDGCGGVMLALGVVMILRPEWLI